MNAVWVPLLGFFSLFFLGFVVSIPPGPGSSTVLRSALLGQKRSGLSAASGVLMADACVYLSLAVGWILLEQSDVFAGSHLTQGLGIAGGIFLMAFAYRALQRPVRFDLPHSESQVRARQSWALTFFNPATWLAFSSLLLVVHSTLGNLGTIPSIGLGLIALELGAATWFLILIFALGKKMPGGQIYKAALICIGLMGIGLVFRHAAIA